MNAVTKETISNIVLTDSLKPYLVILGFSFALMLLGVVTNSGGIGAIFGSSLGAAYPRVNPTYFAGVLLIYFIRRPLIAVSSMIVFSIIFQAFFLGDTNEFRQMAGLDTLGYISVPRIYGGLLLLSFMGFCHFIVLKFNKGHTSN